MNPHPYLSSYLVKTYPLIRIGRNNHQRALNRWHVLISLMPQLSWRTRLALGVWAALFGLGLSALNNHSLPGQPHNLAHNAGSILLGNGKALGAAQPLSVLPGGPSGQMLPPGTLAPAYTYSNSYVRGQCTWYVAGRRPVPKGWGHARSWLAAARRAGWATGTTPAVGAIAWTSAGYYGHVALVEAVDITSGQVLISEMNYYRPYYLSKRWVPARSFKYIY